MVEGVLELFVIFRVVLEWFVKARVVVFVLQNAVLVLN